MADLFAALPAGMSIRSALSSDRGFIENLYRDSRDDLRLIEAESDYVDSLIEMQFRAQRAGYGEQFPDAMYYIVEYQGESVGRMTLSMGQNEVRVVDLAFIRAARGKGFGKGVLQALQMTADKVRVPLTLTVALHNIAAANLYISMGFRAESITETHALMVWYPSAANAPIVVAARSAS
jgi:ribosomal protein S18 acetylase RimI-like enzyme